jgi:hypothetical protein
MVPMYLGRWISFYMDINDQLFAGAKGRCKSSSINQCYAGTKKKQKMFEDETQVSACCVNQIPHHARFVVSQKHQ